MHILFPTREYTYRKHKRHGFRMEKKNILLHIADLLFEKGLISERERNRMKAVINS